MKYKKYVFVVFFLAINLVSFSQGEFIVKIDNTTGNFIKTGPHISGITWITPNVRAYNENSGTFIFASADSIRRLYSIDVSNDAIIYNPIYDNHIVEFEYDNISNTLFGLLKDNINDVKNLVSIDPATGTPTIIGNPIPGSATFQGFSTFNQANTQYIFLDSPNLLYTIDASNGNVLSSHSLIFASGESLICMSYNNSSNQLYGIMQDYNLQKYFLVTINQSSGIITKIGTGTSYGGGSGSSAIDENNQQFYFLYYSTVYFIMTYDISTGNVLYKNPLYTVDCDNFFSLKYDNIQEKLYSIHWDCLMEPESVELKDYNNTLSIYPNPYIDNITIETGFPLSIEITNIEGQVIKTIKIKVNKTTIDLSGLSKGIYYLKSISEKGIAIKKLIKQ